MPRSSLNFQYEPENLIEEYDFIERKAKTVAFRRGITPIILAYGLATLAYVLPSFFNSFSYLKPVGLSTRVFSPTEKQFLPVSRPSSSHFFTLILGKGETLSSIFKRLHVLPDQQKKLVRAIATKIPLRELPVGQKFQVNALELPRKEENMTTPPSIDIKEISFFPSFEKQVRIFQNGNGGFQSEVLKSPIKTNKIAIHGVIHSSLYQDLRKDGVDPKILEQIVKAFSHILDFERDLRGGEKVQAMYEERHNPHTGETRPGHLLFASIVHKSRKKTDTVYLFRPPGQKISDFFNEKGTVVRKTFLRTPVSRARISSRFGMRKHPILGFTRMHRGVDFAAPLNTPIVAAGNGVIEYIGYNRGFGRTIRIRHTGGYKTVYAHMSCYARGLKVGSSVKQGQHIGGVGKTGMASGYHLHFELHKDGRAINPSRIVQLPSVILKGRSLKKFKDYVVALKKDYAKSITGRQGIVLASNPSGKN